MILILSLLKVMSIYTIKICCCVSYQDFDKMHNKNLFHLSIYTIRAQVFIMYINKNLMKYTMETSKICFYENIFVKKFQKMESEKINKNITRSLNLVHINKLFMT